MPFHVNKVFYQKTFGERIVKFVEQFLNEKRHKDHLIRLGKCKGIMGKHFGFEKHYSLKSKLRGSEINYRITLLCGIMFEYLNLFMLRWHLVRVLVRYGKKGLLINELQKQSFTFYLLGMRTSISYAKCKLLDIYYENRKLYLDEFSFYPSRISYETKLIYILLAFALPSLTNQKTYNKF